MFTEEIKQFFAKRCADIFRTNFQNLLNQAVSGHLGHGHVGNYQIKLIMIRMK